MTIAEKKEKSKWLCLVGSKVCKGVCATCRFGYEKKKK